MALQNYLGKFKPMYFENTPSSVKLWSLLVSQIDNSMRTGYVLSLDLVFRFTDIKTSSTFDL